MSQVWRMDEIENWRQKAYTLSRSDKLGHLIMKSLDVMQTVVRDGPSAESLSYEVQSLARLRTKTMNEDPNRDDMQRTALYGMTGSIRLMVEAIIEAESQTKAATMHPQEQVGQNSIGQQGSSHSLESSISDSFLLSDVKLELTDDMIDYSESMDNSMIEMKFQPPNRNQKDAKQSKDMNQEITGKISMVEKSGVTKASSLRCTICKKKFKCQAYLAQHMMCHTGEKPFACEHCDATFRISAKLKNHLRTQHGVKPFECKPCGIKFEKNSELREHNKETDHTTMDTSTPNDISLPIESPSLPDPSSPTNPAIPIESTPPCETPSLPDTSSPNESRSPSETPTPFEHATPIVVSSPKKIALTPDNSCPTENSTRCNNPPISETLSPSEISSTDLATIPIDTTIPSEASSPTLSDTPSLSSTVDSSPCAIPTHINPSIPSETPLHWLSKASTSETPDV